MQLSDFNSRNPMTEGIFTAPNLRVQARHGESPVAQLPVREVARTPVRADARSGRSCAFVVIPNFAHLRDAYGLPFALCVSHEIKSRICLQFVDCESTDLVCLRDDCFLLWTNNAFARRGFSDLCGPSESLERLLAALGGPVRAHGIAALPHVHADWIPAPDPDFLSSSEIELLSWAWAAQPWAAEQRKDAAGANYRSDMAVAVRVSEALAAGRNALWWQPVIDAHAAAATFYREACARFEPACGESLGDFAPSAFMPCLERLGLTRTFDRQMAHAVVEALRLQPTAVMAVNISAQSATLDHWWASLLCMLAADATLARRLIVEISGRLALPDLASAREFCVQLRRCGCRVAVDDFGVGALRLEGLEACRPDIVKLDASFVRGARDGEAGRDSLLDMLQMCRRVTPHVVVDGIDGEGDLQSALKAGARWMQGYYLGSPDVPARSGPDSRRQALPATEDGEDVDMLLPNTLALTGACALAGVGLVLWRDGPLPLSAIGLWSGAVGIWLQRTIFARLSTSETAFGRSPWPARLMLAALGIGSGLVAGSLMAGQALAALCVAAGLVSGLAGGALWERFLSGSRAFPRALRRMRLPLQPACDPAARALACAERAARLLRRRTDGALPAGTALNAYMDGVASGFYGLGAGSPSQPADVEACASRRTTSTLAAIWHEGVGHGGRIRSEQAGGAQ
jgi:EAL domain-containing protein (putative c-di-GMP-specific phosphodiesterase class I)